MSLPPVAHAAPIAAPPAPPSKDAAQFMRDLMLAVELIQSLGTAVPGGAAAAPVLPAAAAFPPPPTSHDALAWMSARPAAAPKPVIKRPPRRMHVPAPPPPSTEVSRAITSATYTRRLFITARLASLFRLDAALAAGGAGASSRLAVVLIDEEDTPWQFAFEQRMEGSPTGSLVGSWTAFCRHHAVTVGDAVRFWRPADFPADTLGGRVAVSRGAASHAAAESAAVAAQASVERCVKGGL